MMKKLQLILRYLIYLVKSRNELIEATLEYLLVDLKLQKYSSNLSVQSLKTINKMLVW